MKNDLLRIVGIDLGTTYSAVAVWDRKTETAIVLPNPDDSRSPMTTPSVVSLDGRTRKVIVGRPAKTNLPSDPLNTIVEIKREMGENCRPPTDKDPGNLHLHFAGEYYQQKHAQGEEEVPFHVRFDEKYDEKNEWFRPQEISAFILMKMKEVAEKAIGEGIINAVITVPAYFTEKQRSATKEAALLAGIYPLQLIPEPTAAAICYGVDHWESARKVYLVYDLGGGTFDVSIITVEEQDVQVIATSGDPRLGGGDFDDVITTWAVQELKEKHNVDVSNDARARAVIKLRAEDAKIELSTYESATINLLDLWPQNPPVLELTRTKFVELIDPLLSKSLTYVDKAVNSAMQKEVGRDQIDAILMVGGSSKIPRVKERLLTHFEKGDEFLKVDLNPDAVVARGAAIMAVGRTLQPGPFDITRKLENMVISSDVERVANVQLITEHSLSVGIQDNLVSRIVEQGTNIPVSVTKAGYTNPAFQPELPCIVYQGEKKHQHENTRIGVLMIGPMEPKPEGFHQFEITFSLDMNGLLTAGVFHRNENKRYQARFDQKTGVPDNEMKWLHNRLLRMYSTDESPIPSPPPGLPGAVSMSDSVSAPPAPPPMARAPKGGADVATWAPPFARSQAGTADATAQAELNVPGEFQQIVSRCRILLAKQPDSRLSAALDAFFQAVRQGAGLVPLADLGDALADAYDEARQRKPAERLEEAVPEIPDQYKQTVRRAAKLHMQQPNPRLLEAYNAFIAALNQGGADDDLAELGDTLADVFDEVRRESPG